MKKQVMELFQMLGDLQREANVPITCSQGSAVSDSWFIDNNPLMAACEANTDFDWKFYSREDGELKYTNLCDDELDFGDLGATDLAFASSVALSPPTSPHDKQTDANEQIMDLIENIEPQASDIEGADMEEECKLLLKDIFEPSDNEADMIEQQSVEAIQNWLMMISSSQGNEFLSSQESVANDLKQVESISTEPVVEVVNKPSSSDVIVEPDVTQIIALPVVIEEESPVVESRPKRKRTLDYSEADSPGYAPKPKRKSPGKSDKKKDQNKEAAKRYRDRKKKESTEFKQQCDELEGKNNDAREKIKDMIKARQVLLELWTSLESEKTNPNFKIKFPDWM